MWSGKLIIVPFICLLSSCSFRPLLSISDKQAALHKIDIKIYPTKSREAHVLNGKMLELLTGIKLPTNKKYTLKINISKSDTNVAVYVDGTVGRDETTYTCKYELIDQNTHESAASGTATSSESHNALFSSSNIIESTYGATNDNQLESVARKIFNHVILYLNEN